MITERLCNKVASLASRLGDTVREALGGPTVGDAVLYSHVQAVAASREVEPAEKEKCVSLFDECMQELDIGVHDVKLGKRRDLT